MADITFEHIKKVYPGAVTAVSDFNLQIKDREFVILVGPSGCGKSTLLRMIAGLEEISGGELRIGDRVVNKVPPKDRNIAMVFQNYALYPHMTVYDNMAFSLSLKKTPKEEIDRRIQEVANSLDIVPFLKRKPKELSGGQQQRVALGRAMVRNPQVFLLDEPLSNLDAKLRGQMRVELSRLHRQLEATFVYVTHDQVEAMTMGDRIVVMKDGLIQQVDSPQNLYDHPLNLFVAGFLGSPQMNQLEATISRDAVGHRVCFGQFSLPLSPTRFAPEVLRPYEGRTVMLGIRPEDIHRGDGQHCLETLVELKELMGSETYLYLRCDGVRLTVKAPARTPEPEGATLGITFDMERVHLFDSETTQAIDHLSQEECSPLTTQQM